MSEVKELWDGLHDQINSFHNTIKLKAIPLDGDYHADEWKDLDLQVHGAVDCAAVSKVDTQTQEKRDQYLLKIMLGFTPPSGREIAMYVIIVRPLEDDKIPFSEFPNESTPWTGYWNGDDDQSGYRWSQDWQPQTLKDAVFMSSDPGNHGNTQSYSSSQSLTVGANAGFFGKTPTAGIDVSYTVSSSQSVTVVPTKIVDGTTNDVLQKAFILQEDKSSHAEYVIQAVMDLKDDGQGVRDRHKPEARIVPLEIRLIILPKDQVKLHPNPDTPKPPPGIDLFLHVKDVKYQAHHEFARVVHLRLPSVPAS